MSFPGTFVRLGSCFLLYTVPTVVIKGLLSPGCLFIFNYYVQLLASIKT